MQFDCELRRSWATNRVQCVLPVKADIRIDVHCGYVRTDLAEIWTYRASGAPPQAIWIALRSRTSEHRMVEYIEVFRAQIELDSLAEIKLAAQREIRLVERVWTAQSVPGKVSRLTKRW